MIKLHLLKHKANPPQTSVNDNVTVSINFSYYALNILNCEKMFK